jgi:hypothetical protein
MKQPGKLNALAQLMKAIACAVFFAMPSVLFAADEYPVEIKASSKAGERFEATFTAFIPDRPVHDSEHGYGPVALDADGQPITIKYVMPLELTWDFGDGSSVTIKERVSASHVYADDGEYTVTLVVRDTVGEFASATHQITIVNNDPANLRIAVTVIDPAQQLVELSAWAEDVPGDSMRFHWDFGDGDSAEGSADEIWWTTHQYMVPGRYEVTLTVSDDDYPPSSDTSERNDGQVVKTIKVVVADGGDSPVEGADQLNEEDLDDGEEIELTNRVKGTSNGLVNSQFNAEVRPFAGLYLSQVASGACRFMFSFRDDAQLMTGMAVLDLFGVPPQGGQFRINKPRFSIEFVADADTYRQKMKFTPGGIGFGDEGVAGLVQKTLDGATTPSGDALNEAQRKAATDKLQDETGIRSQPLPDRAATGMPALSPVVDQDVRFNTVAGSVVLDFIPGDRAVGRFDLTMEVGFGPLKGQSIQLNADLAMDMVVAASDGIVRYAGCEPPPFEIEKIFPDDGFKHLAPRQPAVSINFSDPVDPATLDNQRIQIAYTDTSKALVPVPIRIMRGHDGVYAVPEQPLMPGVTYSVRVLTGDEGVRSRKGSPLDSGGTDKWFTSRFTTRVDMTPITDGRRLLACHIYQPTRDVPLIVGKPAVARIFANWEPQPGVHPDHQVKEFTGTIELYGSESTLVGSVPHTFVRPDLWQERGISLKSAEQTAQVGFIPDVNSTRSLHAFIKVSTSPRWEPGIQYRTVCPLKLWGIHPTLSVDFFALRFDEWKDHPERLDNLMPILQRVADESLDYALQQFPLSDISTDSPVRIVEPDFDVMPLHPEGAPPNFECVSGCILNGMDMEQAIFGVTYWTTEYPSVKDWLSTQSDADIVIVFGPHDRLMGGKTGSTVREGQGTVMVLGGDSAEYFPRYVNGVVHEMGHTLELQHLPFVDEASRAVVVPLRDGSMPFWYEGIEALRIDNDGQAVWNKSSADGNEQSDSLFPLMFPGTIPTDDAFIANHHYRQIQKLLEELNNPAN